MSHTVRGVLLVLFILFFSQNLASVLIPLDAKTAGLGARDVGLLVAMPFAVGLLTDVPFAAWSDVVGRRVPLIIGFGLGAVAAAVLSFTSLSLLIALGTFIWGLCMSLLLIPALAFLTEAAPEEHHATIQGLNGSLQGLSALVGATGGVLLATVLGPGKSFWVMCGSLAIATALASRLRERERSRVAGALSLRAIGYRILRAVRLVRSGSSLPLAASASILSQFQVIIVNSFMPLYLIGLRHYSGLVVGGLLAVRTLVAMTLSAGFGKLSTRVGMVRPLVIGNTLGIIGILLVAAILNPVLLIVPFVLQGAGNAFGPPTSNLLITGATGEGERAIGFSAVNFFARVSGLSLPIVIGLSVQAGGYHWLFVIVAIVGAGGLAAILIFARSLGSSEGPKCDVDAL